MQERKAARVKVLIVDDNRDAAESLTQLIEKMGYEADFTTDPEETLGSVAAMSPSIVLLDLGMPRVDGYEVCRRLRQRYGFDNLCVVALTGYGSAQDRAKSRQVGFDAHLVKPADPELIRSTLEELCQPMGWNRR